MQQYREISVFVAHTYEPDKDLYTPDSFRKSIFVLFDKVRKNLEKIFPNFALNPIIEMETYGDRLAALIDRQLAVCHFGIVDISENSPNVFYELGQLSARNVPHVIIKSRKSLCPIPADISSRLIFFYDKISEIETTLIENLTNSLTEILRDRSFPSELFSNIWFDKDVSYIHIICGPELEKTEFSFRDSQNYIFMDNLEDKDALVEVLMLLSRHYPKARLIRYASNNIPPGIIEGDLVVLGGPGDLDGPGNHVCRQMMHAISSSVSYSDDAESMYVNGAEYKATLDHRGWIAKDYAYFASFPNPFNTTRKVILANGIHTYGTLGATMAFSDHPSAQLNIRQIVEKLDTSEDLQINRLAFECFFEVIALPGGEVSCPQVQTGNGYTLNIGQQ